MRQQLLNAAGFVLRQPCQNIFHIRIEVMSVHARRLDQAYDGGRKLATGEQPVAPVSLCFLRQRLKVLLPRATPAQERVAGMHPAEIVKTRRQIASRDAGTVTVQDCIDEELIVSRSRFKLFRLAEQQILHALLLRIS